MAQPRELVSATKELAAENTAEKITTTSTEVVAVLVRALKANAAAVRIGPETVGATSYELEAGESVEFDFLDLSQVFIYGKKGDKVQYLGLKP